MKNHPEPRRVQGKNLEPAIAPMPKKKKPILQLYRRIAIGFGSLVFILLFLVFYFTLARTEIILTVREEPLISNFSVTVQKESIGLDVIAGKILEATAAESARFPTSGALKTTKEVTGQVVIINNYGRNQPLVAKTRLLSPEGILFRLKQRVEVPAKGQAEVEVYADNPEEGANLGPTHFTIPGLWTGLQDLIYAESKEPMSGLAEEKKVMSSDDLEKARGTLKNNLLKKILEEFNNNLADGEAAIEQTISQEILEEKKSLAAGEEGEEFTLELKIKATGVALNQEELVNKAQEKLAEILPIGQQLLSLQFDDISVITEKMDFAQQQANLRITVSGKMALGPDNQILDKTKLVGLSKEQAKNYFAQFPAITDAAIKLAPPWANRLPPFADRIEIKIIKQK